jgi:hypothetical protein
MGLRLAADGDRRHHGVRVGAHPDVMRLLRDLTRSMVGAGARRALFAWRDRRRADPPRPVVSPGVAEARRL